VAKQTIKLVTWVTQVNMSGWDAFEAASIFGERTSCEASIVSGIAILDRAEGGRGVLQAQRGLLASKLFCTSSMSRPRRRDRGEGAIFVLDDGVNVTPQRRYHGGSRAEK
jgi:hypothetical protein